MYSKESINTSAQAIMPRNNKVSIIPVETQQAKLYQRERRKARNQGLSHLYHEDYKPAVYRKALLFRDSLSYKKKIGQNDYKQLQLLEDTNELKVFGLGPYFFIQFQRRVVWLFFIFSIIQSLRIYINSQGTGLAEYKGSFGTYLVITTIGNFSGNMLTAGDIYILTIIPAAIYAAFFLFYLWWKCSYLSAVSEQDQSKQIVKPQKFCVQIEGFDENDNVKQEQLEELFSAFGPVYEVSLNREYNGNLKYFQEMDELEEQIKQEQLEIILGSGDQKTLKSLKQQKEELNKYIQTLKIRPSVRSAFIHFQFQKSKVEMLQYYSDHYLFSQSKSHSLMRSVCCCCVDDPQPKSLYRGKKLYVKASKVPQPDDINWDNYQVSICGKIIRVLFSTLIILIFLAVSCTIIGLCSVYISTHSVSCQGVTIPATLQDAKSNATITDVEKKCFCSSNFLSSFSNDGIKTYCGTLLDAIYTEQGIQYAITATSTFVNVIFGVIVHKLVSLTQPFSHSTGYLWKTTILTFFLIFNTVFLPLLIYANIFGFQATRYVSFITIISNDIRSFFKVDSISFYVDFEPIWYRNVAPIFINYVILDLILTWVFFILYKCCCSKQNLQSKEGTILQKSMNEKMISWKLNAADEFANFNLIIFMTMFYSSGIPVLIPLGFLNLASKYITNRSLLQTLSSKIQGLSEKFNTFPLTFIPIMLALACVVGQWMLTGNTLISAFTGMRLQLHIEWPILVRQLLYPFFLILAIVIAFEFVFYNIIVRFCTWLANSCYDRKEVAHPYYTREYSFYAKTMSIMYSYNIRNNIKYKNAVFNLEKYLDNQQYKI